VRKKRWDEVSGTITLESSGTDKTPDILVDVYFAAIFQVWLLSRQRILRMAALSWNRWKREKGNSIENIALR